VAVNLAGLPGLVVPCGDDQGLPIGLQLLAPAFAEETLLQIGAEYQRHTQHHLARPALATDVPDI
jgi:aspartyl-tRNA(Asn)/glutamyl-tRNA(Gln) amidotransferase subunit A